MPLDLVNAVAGLKASRAAILAGTPASRETRERLNDSIFDGVQLLKALGADDGDEREPLGNADDLRAELADVVARHETLKERERASRGLSTLQRRQLQDLAERAATIRVWLHEQAKADLHEASAGRAAVAADDDAPKFAKRTGGTRKLGDAFPIGGPTISKSAGAQCICGSARHRPCLFCSECSQLCGHEQI